MSACLVCHLMSALSSGLSDFLRSSSLAVPGFSSIFLMVHGVLSLASASWVFSASWFSSRWSSEASPVSLVMLHDGQKGLDHGFSELDCHDLYCFRDRRSLYQETLQS